MIKKKHLSLVQPKKTSVDDIMKHYFSPFASTCSTENKKKRFVPCVESTAVLFALLETTKQRATDVTEEMTLMYDMYIRTDGARRALPFLSDFAMLEYARLFQPDLADLSALQTSCAATSKEVVGMSFPKAFLTARQMMQLPERTVKVDNEEVLSERSFQSDDERLEKELDKLAGRQRQKAQTHHMTSIDRMAVANDNFRSVHWTNNMQIVFMSLKPGEAIGKEKHKHSDQLFLLFAGSADVVVFQSREDAVGGPPRMLRVNDALVVPARTYHDVRAGSNGAKMMTVYSFPQHAFDTLQHDKPSEAQDAEEERRAKVDQRDAVENLSFHAEDAL